MPRRLLYGLLALVMLSALPPKSDAQMLSRSDQFILEQLALAKLIEETHPADPARRAAYFSGVALEPRLHEVQELSFAWRPMDGRARTPEQSQALGTMLGTGIVLEDEDQCSDPACRVGSNRGLLVFTRARIFGDSASIDIHTRIWYRNRTILDAAIQRFTFVREGNAWRCTDRRYLLIS